MKAKDILTFSTYRGNTTVSNCIFLVQAGTTSQEAENKLRKAVLEFLSTDKGTEEVRQTCQDFNWGDALNTVPDEFYRKQGVDVLDGTPALITGNETNVDVNHDEVLLHPGYPTIVKELDTLNIVKLYASHEDGTYGDIYSQKWDYLENYDEDELMVGYGVSDPLTGFLVDESADFYETLEEAEAFALSMGAKPVINVFEGEGIESTFSHQGNDTNGKMLKFEREIESEVEIVKDNPFPSW
ncbi:hypothetical protein JMA_43970 (plasmid) [Jeotgalibacillus malaysiensis]|uniref:Uncharacterized protein n=1 Tax=Jeotgalibacillus malaysiensis TaxID=1508404 RepID=A0A0B5B0N9_9BACL|nr:hypothetical protein [Jeotgalibacillus malaysiensis]AJD93714.1 hypothetical protein JMA_43970 [Jeotgalibacillus malaysiensis]